MSVDNSMRLWALLEGLGVPLPAFWLEQEPAALKALGAAIAKQAERAAETQEAERK